MKSQEIPAVTGNFGVGVQNEAGQRLIDFCQEHVLVIANTPFQQHKRRLYTWTSPDGQYWNQIDYVLCSQRWRSSIQSAKIRPGTDCGSDHKILISKFRLKLKKVGKTTGEGNGTPPPLQYSCLENPTDGGAWWAAVHGSLRVGHDWATSLSHFTFMHWRRKWQPTPVFLPGDSQGRGSLVGCCLWGHTGSDTTEAT